MTCAEDEILEKDQNYCAKKPSDEVCNRIDTYFNPILEECQAWKTCTDGLFLNRFNNQCLDEFTYQTQCELQNKFWNKAEVTCEEWKICDINTELDITINLCQQAVRTEDYCSNRDYYFDAETAQCEEWKVCEGNDSRLDRT